MFFNRTPPEPTEFGTPLKFSIVCSRMPSGSSAIRMLRFRRIQNGKSFPLYRECAGAVRLGSKGK